MPNLNPLAKRKAIVLSRSEISRDPRVQRVCMTLQGMGYKTFLICTQVESKQTDDLFQGTNVHRIPIKKDFSTLSDSSLDAYYSVSLEIAHEIERCDESALSDYCDRLISFYGHRVKRFVLRMLDEAWPSDKKRRLQDRFDIRAILAQNLAMVEKCRAASADLIYVNDLDCLVAGCILQSKLDAPLLFDAHEIYPEQLPNYLRSELWHSFFSKLERYLIPRADGLVTVSDSIAAYYGRTIDTVDFVTVRNCPERENVVLTRSSGSTPTVLYHGLFAPDRGLEQVIQAASKVNAEFVFRGVGTHERVLKKLVNRMGLSSQVTFAPPVAVSQLIDRAAECDIGLCPFIPVCKNTEYVLPNKFFEYLCAGLCVVSSDLTELTKLTRRYEVGDVYQAENADALATVLNDIIGDKKRLKNYQANALEATRIDLNWEIEEEKLCGVIAEITG